MRTNASGEVKKCLIRFTSILFDTGKWIPNHRKLCNLSILLWSDYPQTAARLLRGVITLIHLLKGSRMIIVCSWCRKEGNNEFLGEKIPFDDERETHGICVIHYREVRTRWQEMVRVPGLSNAQLSRRNVVLSTLRRWRGLLHLARH